MTNTKEYESILITDLANQFLTLSAIKLLKDIEIYTLQDLFEIKTEDLIKKISKARVSQNQPLQNEVIGTIKILKCLYLNEDPKIPFDEPDKINIETDFGLSSLAVTALMHRTTPSGEKINLIDVIKTGEYQKLKFLRCMGNEKIKEIELKCRTAYEYYKKNNREIYGKLELNNLILELKNLENLKKQIEEKIQIIQQDIEKNQLNQK